MISTIGSFNPIVNVGKFTELTESILTDGFFFVRVSLDFLELQDNKLPCNQRSRGI
jgi:hypothetical protein